MNWRLGGAHRTRSVLVVALALLVGSHAAPATMHPSVRMEHSQRFFPLGVFEDGNLVDAASFEAMIDDLSARGLDTVLFTNNWVTRQARLLDISDRRGFNVVFAPSRELDERWWPDSVRADLATARRVIWPLVDRLAGHPSLRAYNIADEPRLELKKKLSLAVRAFRERDPSRPAIPTLVGVDRADVLFAASGPDIMLIDVYPVGWSNGPCDFAMTGFGYPGLDFVAYVRSVTASKPAGVPLWFILQTHRYSGDEPSLREPLPEEVRLQNWLAIGEGAQGLFWFIYSSQQGWRGLSDNPRLFQEVTELARRVGPLRETLSGLRRSQDQSLVSVSGGAYVSTLASDDGARRYAVVANRDCGTSRSFALVTPNGSGLLRDVESGQVLSVGTSMTLRPGDGKLLELLPSGSGACTPRPVAASSASSPDEDRTARISTETPVSSPSGERRRRIRSSV
jgi:hypothetical protein